MLLWQERIESIKAGGLGAIACGTTAIAFSGLEAKFLPGLYPFQLGDALPVVSSLPGFDAQIANLEIIKLESFALQIFSLLPWQSLGWAIAALTGFLFAVTYRYIIRDDPSSHLRSGAVLAFGLVRGMAQVNTAWLLRGDGFMLLVLLGESLALMAIARLVLDLSLSQGWLKPFTGFD